MRPESFWKRVRKTNTCWLWHGATRINGYGMVTFGGKTVSAHTYSLMLDGQSVPKGMHVDHICRVRACVKPEHLRIVTPRENILSTTSPAARNARKTHCLRGHPLTMDNVRKGKFEMHGWRLCVTCHRESTVRWRAKYSERNNALRRAKRRKPAKPPRGGA